MINTKPPPQGTGAAAQRFVIADVRDGRENKPHQQDLQGQALRAVTAARYTHLAEIGALLSELAQHAEVGCMYASLGDERGLGTPLIASLISAVRACDEAERLSSVRQMEDAE